MREQREEIIKNIKQEREQKDFMAVGGGDEGERRERGGKKKGGIFGRK